MKSSIQYLREAEERRVGRARHDRDCHLSGLASRYYVRGAMDPRLSERGAVEDYASAVLRGRDPETALLSVTDRAQIAGEVLTGWEAHRPDGRAADRLLWLRYMAGTVVEVREGKS